eukprot:3447778-Amphidinium_carterae.1
MTVAICEGSVRWPSVVEEQRFALRCWLWSQGHGSMPTSGNARKERLGAKESVVGSEEQSYPKGFGTIHQKKWNSRSAIV